MKGMMVGRDPARIMYGNPYGDASKPGLIPAMPLTDVALRVQNDELWERVKALEKENDFLKRKIKEYENYST